MALGIIIVGALGRMGVEVAKLVLEDDALKLNACIEYPGHPKIGEDYGTCIGKGNLGIKLTDSVAQVDYSNSVVVDFSSPQASRTLLKNAEGKGMKLVICTTGLNEDDLEMARTVSKKVPVIVSPNTSIGVNLLFSITQMVASKLKDDFDIEIIEAHHRFKKDAPSGTAKKLGEIVAAEMGLSYEEAVVNGREGIQSQERSRNVIGMHAIRGGDIVGDHTVLFAGMGERVELRHIAQSRVILARGAITTAKWIANKPAGFYTMKDVLGF